MSPVYGWDASHYDAPPTKRDGIDFYTHKVAEGHHFYKDAEYQQAMNAARGLGIPVLGSYFVQHPGTVADQADWWLSIVNSETPWWRDATFAWQIDAEKFSYMSRAPNVAEINALGDAICARAKVPASSVIAYGPKWLYGDNLKGLKYRLWASNYGTNPAVWYRNAYPGDTSSRWGAYSGQTPVILQYGSRLTIAGQSTCDANAYRGSLDELRALLTDQPQGDDMDAEQSRQLYNLDRLHTALLHGATTVTGLRLQDGTTASMPLPIAAQAKAAADAANQALAIVKTLAAQPAVAVDYDKLADAIVRRVIAGPAS